MQQRTKKIVGFLATFSLTIGLIAGLGHIVRPVVDCDNCIDSIRTFHDMPENSFEVIGYGSSHMWKGLNAMEMYESYGIGAYNYGANWQHINTTLLFMQDSFKTQSPKVVLVECFNVNAVLKDTDMNGEIYHTTALPETKEKQEYLKQCFGDDKERYLSYYMPLCGFHGNWENLTTESFMWNSSTFDYTTTMGSELIDAYGYAAIPDPATLPQWPLSDEALEVLDKMVSLCKENDAEIIFYTQPFQGEYVYNEAMQAYADANSCVYLNLFEKVNEMGLNGEDYYDLGHTNRIGATKIANYLGKYIAENYDVTDMRTVENNIWKQKVENE